MMELNYGRSHCELRDSTLISKIYDQLLRCALLLIFCSGLILLANFEAVAGKLTVNLIDAKSNLSLKKSQITAYRIESDGSLSWYSRHNTDSTGQVEFDLLDSENGTRYQLRTNVYNQFKAYSEPLNNLSSFDFVIGKVRVTLKNGSVDGLPVLANTKISVKRVKPDGGLSWYGSAVTDDAGLLRLNLPDINRGQVYHIRAKSPVNQQSKHSEPLVSDGDFTFIVGNKALSVTLNDAATAEGLSDEKITVYRLDEHDKRQWVTSAHTDNSGLVLFDLDALGKGGRYVLRAKAYSNFSLYTDVITEPGAIDLTVGSIRVNVVNGAEADHPLLQDQQIYIYKQKTDGEKVYFASGYTDDTGLLRIDLPDVDNGQVYLLAAKSPVSGQNKYSAPLTRSGEHQFVVGSSPLVVTLVDGISGDAMPSQRIDVYQLDNDRTKHWYTRADTDSFGKVSFDLTGIDSGRQYKLAARGFGDFKTYSDVLGASGEFTFNVGSTSVHLKNGTLPSQPPLPNTALSIMTVKDGKNAWFGSATSDANGDVRLDLPGINEGVVYRFKAPSPVNNVKKYSGVVTQSGNVDFVVGNPAVTVRLSNILTGEFYPNERVTAYRLNEAGEREWYGRLDTDENGVVVFDLDGINSGHPYIFKASKFETGRSYSQVITTPSNVSFAIGAVPVTLIDKTSGQLLSGVKITAYQISNEGKLNWAKSGYTNASGQLTFDLRGLDEGKRFAFKAHNPFGEERRYYGPIITSIGAIDFSVKEGEFGELDLTAPQISVDTPEQNIANSGGFTASGFASDNQAVEHVEMIVRDPVAGSHTIAASFDETSNRWQADVLPDWVSIGETVTITATAFDYALNSTSSNRAYLITEDIALPVIEVASHQNLDSVNVIGFTVIGTVTDDIAVASITATLTDPLLGETISDQPLNIASQSGQWALVVTNGKVSANQTVNVNLLATDINGKTSTESIELSVIQITNDPVQLVQRITFGMTPTLLIRLKNGDDILTEQLNPDTIDDAEFEAEMAARVIVDEEQLKDYLLTYMIRSKKQLTEVMAWFWENHFNTNINSHGVVQYELRENNLFRQHALGRFRDLLASSAKSPAMILYLNNAQNVAGRANENYAREIMELHTLGVDGGYTAVDIAELSRVFTGWHELEGEFFFNDDLHDNGDKSFLGHPINGGGVNEGEQVLDILASHQSTAIFICSKLVTLFVSDQPVNLLQAQCAAEFLTSDGDIKAVLQVIFGSEQFAADEHYRSKIKTPLELVTATARGFNAQINIEQVSRELGAMGMRLFEFPAPTGFSEVAEDWLNSNAVLQRMRLVNLAAWQQSDAFNIDFRQLVLQQGFSSAQAVVSFLFELALANEFTDLEYQIALSILNDVQPFDINANDADDKLRRLLGTVLSFPGYQYQ
jgi:uncharacterized protein (DUF1800 family)/5-hydroxyisourate hydrolase-like protein (transthyretin family)